MPVSARLGLSPSPGPPGVHGYGLALTESLRLSRVRLALSRRDGPGAQAQAGGVMVVPCRAGGRGDSDPSHIPFLDDSERAGGHHDADSDSSSSRTTT